MSAAHLAQILGQTLNADPNARIQAELTLADALNDPRACHPHTRVLHAAVAHRINGQKTRCCSRRLYALKMPISRCARYVYFACAVSNGIS